MLENGTVPTRVVVVSVAVPELPSPPIPGKGTFRFTRGAPDAQPPPPTAEDAADTPIVVEKPIEP